MLVVTGAGIKPHGHGHRAAVHEIDADAAALLSHLGVLG